MQPAYPVFRIFASSPEDVRDERKTAARLVDELNLLWGRFLAFHVELLQDESDTYPGVGKYAQAVVNKQIADDYDVYLGVMGARLGTPTPQAGSGTEEEFNRALARWKKDPGSVDIMFYFKRIDPAAALDTEQLRKVEEFRRRILGEGVLYTLFADTDEFCSLFRLGLARRIQQWLRDTSVVELQVPTDIQKFTQPSQSQARRSSESLQETLNEITAVINQLGTALMQRDSELKHASTSEEVAEIIRQSASDFITFADQMHERVLDFDGHFAKILDAYSKAAVHLVVPAKGRKLVLTLLKMQLLLLQQKIIEVHSVLREFHTSIGAYRAMYSHYATALAKALGVVETLLNSMKATEVRITEVVAVYEDIGHSLPDDTSEWSIDL